MSHATCPCCCKAPESQDISFVGCQHLQVDPAAAPWPTPAGCSRTHGLRMCYTLPVPSWLPWRIVGDTFARTVVGTCNNVGGLAVQTDMLQTSRHACRAPHCEVAMRLTTEVLVRSCAPLSVRVGSICGSCSCHGQCCSLRMDAMITVQHLVQSKQFTAYATCV